MGCCTSTTATTATSIIEQKQVPSSPPPPPPPHRMSGALSNQSSSEFSPSSSHSPVSRHQHARQLIALMNSTTESGGSNKSPTVATIGGNGSVRTGDSSSFVLSNFDDTEGPFLRSRSPSSSETFSATAARAESKQHIVCYYSVRVVERVVFLYYDAATTTATSRRAHPSLHQ
eukprot:PhM_4_TR8467/c2_g1_i1/m.47143